MNAMHWTNPVKLPDHVKRWLGATPADPNLDAWAAMVAALRDSVKNSWADTRASYFGLKNVREKLGLPWMGSAVGEGVDQGAWTADLDQQAVDLQAVHDILVQAANDVLANKRKLVWDSKLHDFVIEGLPDDYVRVQRVASAPTMKDTIGLVIGSTGQPTHSSGTVGMLPLLIGAGAVVSVVQGLALYAVAKEAFATLRTVSEHKMIRTLSDNQVKLMEKGATAEEAAKATQAITQGVAAIKQEEVKLEQAKGSSSNVNQWGDLITKVGLVAGGLGLLYIAFQFVPKRGASRSEGGVSYTPALAGARLQENRGRSRRTRRTRH